MNGAPHSPVPTLIVGNGDRAARAAMLVDAARAAAPGKALVLSGRFAADPPFELPPDLATSAEVRRAINACACCVGAVMFRVALVRWLREVRPTALAIELLPGWHIEGFAAMLRGEAYAALVRVERVLDLDRR